ncbi:MAG: ABC transporter substrate-binding protein [Thermodesulfovibrionales bacterium]|nr:ABC transporter substrate-binding protein [Thermodesulfovibrionales bacterium]
MKKLEVRTKIIICVWVFLFLSGFIGYTQEDYPQRIISLGPSITKALYLLGVGDKLIANTVYCDSPPEAKTKEKIGTVVEINIEEVFNLKPDLVLATSLTDPKTKEKLKNLGIKVITFSTPKDFSDLCRQFLELGRVVGKEKDAEKIVKTAKYEINLIKKKVKDLPRPKVLIQVGAMPLFVATDRYFVNDYIEFAGGVNIAKDAKEGIYSREKVLEANPDVIIIPEMGITGGEEKKVWKKYKTLSAVKDDRIYIIDADKLTSPTPMSFIKTLKEIVHILHPGKIK